MYRAGSVKFGSKLPQLIGLYVCMYAVTHVNKYALAFNVCVGGGFGGFGLVNGINIKVHDRGMDTLYMDVAFGIFYQNMCVLIIKYMMVMYFKSTSTLVFCKCKVSHDSNIA